MALRYDRTLGVWDFDTLTTNGLLADLGPLGLHATFGAGAASPTRNLSGGYTLDGGDYWQLANDAMTRFYAAAPTGAFTAAWVGSYSTTTGGAPRVFSCWNSTGGGVDDGIMVVMTDVANAGRARVYQCQGAAAQPYVSSAAADPYMHVGGRQCVILTVETTPLGMMNDQACGVAWGVGAFGTAVYDATVVPRIGMDPAGTNALTGGLNYLLLYRDPLSEDDQRDLMAHMVEGRKPFCYRR